MSAQSKLEKVTEARAKAFADTPARKRLAALFDPGSFVELDGFATVGGAPAGVVCGYGAVMGGPVYAFAQDSTEGGGAVGAMHAAKIKKLYDLALKTGVPVIGIYDSNGARVSEGAGALNALGEMLLQINNLSGVVPQISLVLGTCVGSSAMLACCADLVIMSEKAEFYFQPPQPGETQVGTAASAAQSGVAHIVRPDDAAAIDTARTLVSMMPLNNLAAPPVREHSVPDGEEILRAACENLAGTDAMDILAALCDSGSFIELSSTFGKTACAGLATMGGYTCGLVATKGGRLCANACSKIAKLVSVCDAYQIPVITLVNTTGISVTEEQELSGAVRSMARAAHVYAEATTAKIAVITGEAYGSAYVALASKAAASDYTIAWPSAVISALPPTAAVAFQYGDRISAETPREAVEEAYKENEASPFAAAAGGYIDDVIDPAVTRAALLAALDLLSAKRVHKNPKKHGNLPL